MPHRNQECFENIHTSHMNEIYHNVEPQCVSGKEVETRRYRSCYHVILCILFLANVASIVLLNLSIFTNILPRTDEIKIGNKKEEIVNLTRANIEMAINKLREHGNLCYMGMKSFMIPNSAITASSFWKDWNAPYRARLDNKYVAGVNKGAWSAKHETIGEWLQVDLGNVREVAGVITQGRPHQLDQYVSSYSVSCGEQENSLTFVTEHGQRKVFTGNSDMETKVYNRFPEVLHCRFIRIYPQDWNNHISMRVEFFHGACFNNPHLPQT